MSGDSDRERALETITAALAAVRGEVTLPDVAQRVLDDLSSAGFAVVERWTFDPDVLTGAFRDEKVVWEPVVTEWTVPTLAEATAMAAVVGRLLNPCPECRGTGTTGPNQCEACAGIGTPAWCAQVFE